MRKSILSILVFLLSFYPINLIFGQSSENCFLTDFEEKKASVPPSVNADKPPGAATDTVTIQGDTLGKVSKYIFGNAIAAWAGAHDNPTFVEGVQFLAPTIIRFPGGSWSNGYFWNGVPSDVPDSIYDGTTYNSTTKTATKNQFWGQTGKGGWQTTPNQWYALRDAAGSEGLITVNYGYARYGTSDDPVGQAAHYAADWVRYDDGRTRFWEIGNENGGPWEYGWMIDTALNKDGQPQIQSGELYGKHFKVFADSMRKAAADIGAEIYIGGQIVVYGESSWNSVDKTWNQGFFKEVGDSADFYVIHNYFSGGGSTVNGILTFASTEVKKNMDYIKQDIQKKGASSKPVALTEYNIGFGDDPRMIGTSFINGMQSVVLFNELIKNNFGLSCRWLLVSGEGNLFYGGSDNNYLNHPRPEFYYTIYLQNFTGDHSISASSSNKDILCYATRFSSGETGVVIINKNTTERVVSINANLIGVGNNYYIYSFTGGTDNDPFSQNVYINGNGPDTYQWGPYENLNSIPADKYSTGNEIKFTSPGKSIQYIMLEKGTPIASVDDKKSTVINEFKLHQNYPNPFNPATKISYEVPVEEFVTLKVYDLLGREAATLVNEQKAPGNYTVQFDASKLSSGMYMYSLKAGSFFATKKLLLVK